MIRIIISIFSAAILLACGAPNDSADEVVSRDIDESQASVTAISPDNPLLTAWTTLFGTPPFDQIESQHYLPALRFGMAEQQQEIAAIVANQQAPNFYNTVHALERSGRSLRKVQRVFNAVNGAHSNETTQETAKIFAPELSAHRDDITLNSALFERISTVYEQRESLQGEQLRLLEETHKRFVRAGANLDSAARSRLRTINAELASGTESFRQNVLDETNDFELLVTEKEDLGDLPQNLVDLAAAEAKKRGHQCQCWSFTLQRPSINPFLQYSPNREMRKYLYDGYAMRGNNYNDADNKAILSRMAKLRAERAALLGFDSHAAYVLADRMAENTDLVYALLERIWTPALEAARRDRDERQAMMSADGIDDKLKGWDWRYYTEKIRKAKYDFDEDELRPYFEVNRVRDGAFELAKRLFGITFERRSNIPGWHPDQQVFEVFDADGDHLAMLYMDFFARESKRGGAWMNSLRQQLKLDGDVRPIVTNNFNFPAPTENSPSLLSLGEAETLFHEFGHALHGMFSNVTYESLAGTSTPRDFVEFPSQVMENWMNEPEVLRSFARHFESNEEIPEDVIAKIAALAQFDQGFKTVEYLAAAYLDMAYHVIDGAEAVEPNAFEAATMTDIGLIEEIIPRYRSTYFSHIFAGGYSAGYYSYLWSEVLDADAFQAFKENGLFDQETAARYREHILSRGGTRPGMELYEEFRGRAPDIEALLRRRGFN